MRTLICLLVVVCLAVPACAKPVLNKSAEAKGFLLEKSDVPALKMTRLKPSRWLISDGSDGGYSYVSSVEQRWWKSGDRTAVLVEAGIFPAQTDALKAAELRVKQLKVRKSLEEKMLKGGQLPGQSKGDRVWGLWDPPEPDKPRDRCRNIGPISTFGAVVFVKKEVCIEVSAESEVTSVSLDDLAQLAKKIATKIKPRPEAAGHNNREKQE